jgi:hypothetical protein
MSGSSDTERRLAARVYFEPLRVRVVGTREGILVDLSEGGALVLFPSELRAGREVHLQIEWESQSVPVPARVKRCVAHNVCLASATLARKQYDVAVEFFDVPPQSAEAIRQILQRRSA